MADMAILPRPASPRAAWRDLKFFLAQRRKHELLFATLSVAMTMVLVTAFYFDSRIEKEWQRNITYIESWPLTRTDAEIIAAQKVHAEAKKRREAEIAAKKEERRQQFERLDRQLEALGI